ncbi:hypothetical protein BKA62DRAFT_817668 [Auriculariales sp. MPI-PUGE-AT-0066]|nr:hypothetical protein BKA62DRAFT_817668 [Auriculariales sp. MPI-PUGE-AT-0066]
MLADSFVAAVALFRWLVLCPRFQCNVYPGVLERAVQARSVLLQRAALAQGYSILSYDALGSGRSAHPDPLNVVQLPLLTQLVVGIVQAVRSDLPVDAAVFTGVRTWVLYHARVETDWHLLPVYQFTHSGEAISNLTLAHGDLQIAPNFPGSLRLVKRWLHGCTGSHLFYAPPGSYEEGAFEYDTANQDTALSDSHSLSGDQDVTSATSLDAPTYSKRPHSTPPPASFEAQVIPNTGHVLNLHKSSVATYTVILDWLTRIGF